jgi:hypothetical protein
MTSRASSITSALAHRQGVHGQGHAVSDHVIEQTVNALVVPTRLPARGASHGVDG